MPAPVGAASSVSVDAASASVASVSNTAPLLPLPDSSTLLDRSKAVIRVRDDQSGASWLADTGAARSFVPATAEDKVAVPKPNLTLFKTADGSPCAVYGLRRLRINLGPLGAY